MGGFSLELPWGIYRMVDVFSAVPQLGIAYEPRWLSWRFLRVVSSLEALVEMERAGAFASFAVSEYTKAVSLIAMQTLGLITTFAGVVFVLEVLGEIPRVEDQFYVTPNGDTISPFQCWYWMITTVSTVGYGDFAPKTMLSRLFVCAAILIGVSWFGYSTGSLMRLKAEHDRGRDSRKLPTSGHVVIIGGGLQAYNAILAAMLGQLYGGPPDELDGIPKTVLMASRNKDQALLDSWMQRVPKPRRTKVQYFAGSPMVAADLHKVNIKEAHMVIVCANPNAEHPTMEDGENLMHALAVLEADPEAKIRLMLLNSQAQTWAVSSGIPEEKCICINELKVNMLSQCCRCHGYSTLLSLLLRPDVVDVAATEIPVKWLVDFWNGSNRRIQGVLLDEAMAGKPWAKVALELYEERQLAVVAAQISGKIILNPMGQRQPVLENRDWNVAAAGDVVFIIGDKQDDLSVGTWRNPFLKARRQNVMDRDHGHYIAFFDHAKEEQHFRRSRTRILADEEERSKPMSPRSTKQSAVSTKSLTQLAFMPKLFTTAREQRLRYQRLKAVHGHTLVLIAHNPGCGTSYPSQVVSSFIYPLRSGSQWEVRPLIILSEIEAPEWLQAANPSVVFLSGDIKNAGNLRQLNLEKRILTEIVYLVEAAPIVRTGSIYPHELVCLEDSPCVVITHMLEVLLRDCANTQVYTLYELADARSASLLGHNPDDISDEDPKNHRYSKAVGRSEADVRVGLQEMDGDSATDFYQLPGFAGGHLFTIDFIGQIIAMEAVFPAMIELLEGMITPKSRGQHCESFLVPLPQEAFEESWNYGDLMRKWTLPDGGATLLGLYRSCAGVDSVSSGATTGSASPRIDHRMSIAPKMKIKKNGSANRSKPPAMVKRFVFVCPPPQERLFQGDLAYVLATAEWAKQRAQEDGTLQQLDIYGHPTWLKTLNDEDEELPVQATHESEASNGKCDALMEMFDGKLEELDV